MKVLSIDPGGTTGWCAAEDWVVYDMGEWTPEQLYFAMNKIDDFDMVICEDYIIRKPQTATTYNHVWSRGETLRLIGAIHYACWEYDIPLVLQSATIKPVASGYTKGKIPYTKGKKGMHIYDALLHLIYYAIREKKIPIGHLLPGSKVQAAAGS